MHLTHKARAYKENTKWRAKAAGIKHPFSLDTSCCVTMHWFRSRKSGDLDNRIKILLDALQGAAYESDSQVVELHAYREDDKLNPRCEIVIAPITN